MQIDAAHLNVRIISSGYMCEDDGVTISAARSQKNYYAASRSRVFPSPLTSLCLYRHSEIHLTGAGRVDSK